VTGHELAARVLDALLREDYGGLSLRVRSGPCGPFLDLPSCPGRTGLEVPLEPDRFLADFRVRRSFRSRIGLDHVLAVLAAVSHPLDRAGVAAFAAECEQALAALRLRERHLPGVHARLARLRHADPEAALGTRGQLGYEALAAAMPHPAYPTAQCRLDFTDEDSLRYAPEYLPEFELNWVALPAAALVRAGDGQPLWWPAPADVGLPDSLAATHDLVPVHPLTARGPLAAALAEAGLDRSRPAGEPGTSARPDAARAKAVIAPGRHLTVIPTLSTRTVAVAADPGAHLKLPLPTSTLGLRNRRSIVPATLADGALVRGVVAAAIRADGQLGRLLLADESRYAHAGHPYLGYLLRRLPPGIEGSRIVPVAALLAPEPQAAQARGVPERVSGSPLVIGELARQPFGGSLEALLDGYLSLLFDIHVRLFVRYGIAMEAHQQNAAVVIDETGMRLLVRDFDGALIQHARLAAALGTAAPPRHAFADPRLITESDDALADVFITITVHLCAGALAFGLAERGIAPLDDLLGLIRRRLTDALDRHSGSPQAALLRARLFDAERLPGKSMVTAGTLVGKARTRASDINKFYGTSGPNYLRGRQ